MKAMKSMNMNRMLGNLKRKTNTNTATESPTAASTVTGGESQPETPGQTAARNVKLFCDSGSPDGSGEEVLFLPAIVEAAESSPDAAKECAHIIRKFLSKDHFDKPYIQYNAIMLIRILADNPGKTFTRNVDTKFAQTVKDLLRVGRDPSVKQILMETLDIFQREKADDEGLAMLNEMWKKEHEKMIKLHGVGGPRVMALAMATPPPNPQSNQNYFSRNHTSRRLPGPEELASRIEEARTSAKLLSQVVQSTPPSDIQQNELVREFADRCQSASRSLQAYMVAENPSPDNDTMETLIETNELLSKAISQHQRAVLNARKALGNGQAAKTTSVGQPPGRTQSGFAAPPPGPPPNGKAAKTIPQIPPPGEFAPTFSEEEQEERNPFADPENTHHTGKGSKGNTSFPADAPSSATGFIDTLGVEPYHPGFKGSPIQTETPRSGLGRASAHAEEEDVSPQSAKAPEPTAKMPVYRY